MTDKEKKSKIADILLEFYDEYQCNMPNRPMIPSLYASKIIDSLQEEPVSEELGDYINKLSKQFPEVSFAKLSRIAVRVAKWQKQKDAQERFVKKEMGYIKGYKEKALKMLECTEQEPVNKCLDEEIKRCIYDAFFDLDGIAIQGTSLYASVEDMVGIARHFANWQKEQEYTCYEEAFEDGASWKKEEMMKDAVDATVHIDAGGYPYIPQIELYDYDKDVPLAKEGDKYKVILIKED